MARIVVVGGTGHIGGYLVPRLVAAGHEVLVLSRGESAPARSAAAWKSVTTVTVDRRAAEEVGTFGGRVRDLAPDVVIDLICFEPDSARQLVEALHGHVQHFLHCGTLWVHGHSTEVPTTEDAPRRPFGAYGTQKAEIERYLLDQARRHGFPATVLHPGHITGPARPPINPAGNLDLGVFATLAAGEQLVLPNLGLETLHHVHADDVAQAFTAAMAYRGSALAESFHIASPRAITLRGYAEAVAGWYGTRADLGYLGWDSWRHTVDERSAALTWDHIAHSPHSSIDKARRLLGYQPRFSSLQAVRDALVPLAARGDIPPLD